MKDNSVEVITQTFGTIGGDRILRRQVSFKQIAQ